MNAPFGLPSTAPLKAIERRLNRGVLPRGHIDGLTLSNDTDDATNDIDIAAGVARSAVNIVNGEASTLSRDQIDLELPVSITKQLDVAFAPDNYDPDGYSGGDRSGGRSSSAISDTTWHALLIGGRDMQTDVVLHDSATQANILAELQKIGGYSAYRRIGSVIRSTSIRSFLQYGDEFWWVTPIEDISTTTLGATRTNFTLTVPTGLVVKARIMGLANGAAAADYVYFSNPNLTDSAAASSTGLITAQATASGTGFVLDMPTDTSARISARASNANFVLHARTRGWLDPRGRNA